MTTELTPQERLDNLLKKIRDFVGDGNYIYRGEPRKDRDIEGGGIEENPPVSSNLYRQFEKAAGVSGFSVDTVQKEILKSVKEHIKEENEDAILEQLQHYGGKTNQIDFTTDYLVALFFACEAEPEKDGRLIFMDRGDQNMEWSVYEPKYPENRVIAQKSIFVRPRYGIGTVEAGEIIPIDKELKTLMLSYLDRHHNIKPSSIYNDIHGFIDRSRNYANAHTNFYLGLGYYGEGNCEKAIHYYTEALRYEIGFLTYYYRGAAYYKMKKYDEAIADFDRTLELESDYVDGYVSRSVAYDKKGKHNMSVADMDKAIDVSRSHINTYNLRGNIYRKYGEHELAIADFDKVIEMDVGYASAYLNRAISKKALGNYNVTDDLGKALQLASQYGDRYLIEDVLEEIKKSHSDSDSNSLPPTDSKSD